MACLLMISYRLGYAVNERSLDTARNITHNLRDEPFELLAVECFFCFSF